MIETKTSIKLISYSCHADIPDRIDGMPLTDVRFINIKLITLPELQIITELGAEGRRRLAALLTGPDRLVSSVLRESAL